MDSMSIILAGLGIAGFLQILSGPPWWYVASLAQLRTCF